MVAIPEREVENPFGDNEVATRQSFNGLIAVSRDRQIGAQVFSFHGHIKLPPDPKQGEAVAHKETIAEVGFVLGIGSVPLAPLGRCVVEKRQQSLAAAVGCSEEQRAIATPHILWFEQKKVCRELNFARRIQRRVLDVCDYQIGGVAWIDFVINPSREFFVRPCEPVRRVTRQVATRLYFNARYLSA